MTSTRGNAEGRRPPWVPWVAGAVGVVVLVLLAIVVLSLSLQRGQQGVLAGVTVDGRDVSGATRAELSQVVRERADARRSEPVVIEGEREGVRATRGQVGADFDEDATISEAWSLGRRGIIGSLADHLASRRGQRIDVPLEEQVDEEQVRRFAADAAEQLSVPPRDAAMTFDASEDPSGGGDEPRVVVTESAQGEQVDAEALGDALVERLAEELGAVRVSAPGEPVEPAVTDADIAEERRDAERAVSGAVTLRNPGGGDDVELSPRQIAHVLGVRIDPEAPEGERAELVADPDRLAEHVDRAAVETEPTEATFMVEGDDVAIAGGEPGFAIDVTATADAVLDAALSAERVGELQGDVTEPDFSRAEAEELGIAQEVASFTTEHAPGEPRVQNIQRFADIVEGAVIRPGERFSLNGHVGPRTREKGFVADGVIVDGELVDQVGGGVSQYATTFFNTAWFAGVRILEHQPHSYYISRYPEGRESTISYGAIDVVIENDSPHGILVSHHYTDTSITVRFFSTPWAEVDSWTSERRNIRPGEVADGFTVDYGRTITYPGGETREESYTWTYEPNDGEEADE